MNELFDDDLEPELRDVADRVTEALRARVPERAAARHVAMLRAEAGRGNVVVLGRLRRRLVVTGLAAALVLGSVPVAWGADGSVPGDVLYGVDRALERVELAVTRTPEAKAKRSLEMVAERLKEIGELERRGDLDRIAKTAEDAVDTGERAVELASGDPEVQATVREAVAKHLARLAEVRDALAAKGKAAQAALDAIERVIERGTPGGPGSGKGKPDSSGDQTTPSPEESDEPDQTSAPGKSGEHRQDGSGGSSGGSSGGQGSSSGGPGSGKSQGQPGQGRVEAPGYSEGRKSGKDR